MAMSERLYQHYTLDQIELLLEFVRQGREFNDRKAAELEQRNRGRASPWGGAGAPPLGVSRQ